MSSTENNSDLYFYVFLFWLSIVLISSSMRKWQMNDEWIEDMKDLVTVLILWPDNPRPALINGIRKPPKGLLREEKELFFSFPRKSIKPFYFASLIKLSQLWETLSILLEVEQLFLYTCASFSVLLSEPTVETPKLGASRTADSETASLL